MGWAGDLICCYDQTLYLVTFPRWLCIPAIRRGVLLSYFYPGWNQIPDQKWLPGGRVYLGFLTGRPGGAGGLWSESRDMNAVAQLALSFLFSLEPMGCYFL